nr:GNAT family N-acetyltransferase [Acidicapsa dinghuensis]
MSEKSEVIVRIARPDDSAVCGPICYAAFCAINAAHNFPCDFPSEEHCTKLLSRIFENSGIYSVVAEIDGRVVGSNALDERSIICGVGPITVDPTIQNRGVGRKLMQVAIERAQQRGAAGIRLVQAAFHNRSFSLYASLGFDVREPLSCMQGHALSQSIPGRTVRNATPADAQACNTLAYRLHGYARELELSTGIERGLARVVESNGHITGYTSHLGFLGHTVAESNLDLQALIAGAESLAGPGILVPSRNTELVRWCLNQGLRVVQPMTLMSMGLYSEPEGAWLPSVLF